MKACITTAERPQASVICLELSLFINRTGSAGTAEMQVEAVAEIPF
jgi:hypothetical protein